MPACAVFECKKKSNASSLSKDGVAFHLPERVLYSWTPPPCTMSVFHDEVELEDLEYAPEEETYYYPCPCGDRFQISKEELLAGEEVATCPSCSLLIKIIYDREKFLAEMEELPGEDAQREALKA